MGSPAFAVPSLRSLADGGNTKGRPFEVVGVVTQPDRPAGRGRELRAPAIKILARELGLPTLQPGKLQMPEVMNQLRLWSPDLIVVAAFGQILRTDLLVLPSHGCINVHASLLPRWRGAAPIPAAILAGDSETGVTIMKMDRGVDTGGILAQRRIPIDELETGGSLSEKLAPLGADLLVSTLPRYLSGELELQPQVDRAATYAPILKKGDGLLDFTRPADELARHVRAHNPRPGAFLEWNGQPFKVHIAHVEAGNARVGQRVILHGQAAIGTGRGLLVLDGVQPAGKKPMSGQAFLAGARGWLS
jgi:methionyl-tRNA formyltransferase